MRAISSERPATLAIVVAVALTAWRSVTPLIEQQLNSDEALLGLMAKHLVEGRAFPLHLYSLPHMLGILSWVAAPFFVLGGRTVVMLKLPLLFINIAIAWLLVDRLLRDVHLRPAMALVATSPFILAPPILSHQHYMDAGGGNPEPLLFVLLLWVLRRRPISFGILLGVAILNRPFAIYGAAALLAVQCWDRSVFKRDVWKGWLISTAAVAAVWALIETLRFWSSPRGPGTFFDGTLPDPIAANAAFVCFDPSRIVAGTWTFAADVLPFILGSDHPLPRFPYFVLVLILVISARLLWVARTTPSRERNPLEFAVHLTIVGILSAEMYVAARCGFVDVQTLRYALLTPFAMVGVLAIVFALEPRRYLRALVAGAVCLWAIAQSVQHTGLLVTALSHGPANPRRELARYLDDHDVRYAWADYWDTLTLNFLTSERVVVASENVVRVEMYQRQVEAHADQAVRIRRTSCPGGQEVVKGRYWLCR